MTIPLEIRRLVLNAENGLHAVSVSDALQLDVVPITELDITGRVRLHRPDYPDVPIGNWAIGVSNLDLALASFERNRCPEAPEVSLGHLGLGDDTRPVVCPVFADPGRSTTWCVEFEGRAVWLLTRDVDLCDDDHGVSTSPDHFPTEHHEWSPRGAEDYLRAELTRLAAAEEVETAAHAKAAAARLIVLGGWH